MDDMEQKPNSILGNPEMMAQIMSMAQAMGGESAPPKPEATPPPPPPQLGMDMGTIQKIASFAQRSGIDRNQQALLKALRPYLSQERIVKLEKAMRAAKIAGVASTALGGVGAIFNPGR